MSPSSPLYNGELIAVPQAHHTAAPEQSPFASLLAQGRAARTAQLDQLDAAILDNYEYGLEQNRAARARQVEKDTRTALINKMSRPNGDADGFFDKNGIYQKEKAELFMQQQLARLDGFDQGFITQNARRKAQEAHAQTRDALDVMMKSTILRSVQERATLAAKQNFDLAMAQGDYVTADAVALDGKRTGAFSQQQAAMYSWQAQQGQRKSDIQAAVANLDTVTLYEIVSDENASQEERNLAQQGLEQVRRTRNSISPHAPMTMEQQEKSYNKAAAKLTKDNYALLRPGVPRSVLELRRKYNQSFVNNPTAIQEAEKKAPAIATEMIQSKDPSEAASFKEAITAMGVKPEVADKIIKDRHDQLEGVFSIDTKQLFNLMPELNVFNLENKGRVENWRLQYNEVSAKILKATQQGDPIAQEDKDLAQKLKDTLARWDKYEKEARAEMYNNTNAQFHVWRNTWKLRNNGAEPPPKEAMDAYFDICDKYLQDRVKRAWAGEFTSEYVKQKDKEWDTLQAQRNARLADSLTNSSYRVAHDLQHRMKQPQKPVSVIEFIENAKAFKLDESLPTETHRNLPDYTKANIIYVPKDVEAPEIVDVDLDKNSAVTVAIVKTDAVSQPTLSLFLKSGIKNANAYNKIAFYRNRAKLYYVAPYGLYPEDEDGSSFKDDIFRNNGSNEYNQIIDEGLDYQGVKDAERRFRQQVLTAPFPTDDTDDAEEATQVADEHPNGDFLPTN